MKKDYWDITNEEALEKTGKPLTEWKDLLQAYGAADKKSNDVVAHIQAVHGVPRYWARTITTLVFETNVIIYTYRNIIKLPWQPIPSRVELR